MNWKIFLEKFLDLVAPGNQKKMFKEKNYLSLSLLIGIPSLLIFSYSIASWVFEISILPLWVVYLLGLGAIYTITCFSIAYKEDKNMQIEKKHEFQKKNIMKRKAEEKIKIQIEKGDSLWRSAVITEKSISELQHDLDSSMIEAVQKDELGQLRSKIKIWEEYNTELLLHLPNENEFHKEYVEVLKGGFTTGEGSTFSELMENERKRIKTSLDKLTSIQQRLPFC